jgi:UDP-N-acetylglucosamine 2-epimerase
MGYFFSLVVGVYSMRVALVIDTRPQIIKSAPIVHDVKE